MPGIMDYYSPMAALNDKLKNTAELSASEKDLLVPCGYGHMADGDIQISIGVAAKAEAGKEIITKIKAISDKFLFEYVSQRGGSITGEHGVG